MMKSISRNAIALAFLAISGQAGIGEELISAQQASLPEATNIEIPTRGLTRGPTIEQVSPDPEKAAQDPINVTIRFRAFNNVAIDLNSIKATYMKFPNIDLTDKFKKYVTAEGFSMKNMNVPSGDHLIRIDIRDTQGREGSALIKLKVVK
jgi:hypothetical protein